jgi:hypothetical protein
MVFDDFFVFSYAVLLRSSLTQFSYALLLRSSLTLFSYSVLLLSSLTKIFILHLFSFQNLKFEALLFVYFNLMLYFFINTHFCQKFFHFFLILKWKVFMTKFGAVKFKLYKLKAVQIIFLREYSSHHL